MKTLFVALQVLTGLTTLAGLAVLAAFVMLQSLASFVKDSVVTLGDVLLLFLSLFTSSPPARHTTGMAISPPQVALVIVFGAMLCGVFLPGYRMLLHVVAVLVAAAIGYCLWTWWQPARFDAIYIPFLGFWLLYYAASTVGAERFALSAPVR